MKPIIKWIFMASIFFFLLSNFKDFICANYNQNHIRYIQDWMRQVSRLQYTVNETIVKYDKIVRFFNNCQKNVLRKH
jgi:flagellar biosynthesis protein FlhB